MSAAPLRQQRPARGRPAAPPAPGERPHLRSVQAPEPSRSLVPFAWACVAVVLAALASVLLVNTAMAEGAYERRDLKIEIASLHKERAGYLETLEANSSPANLAARAEGLGMAPAMALGFMSLSDGIVLETGK
ncbi:hypothetical protein [Demequina sp.]|uniref:hypothetical protein n=1 Tax=Demequina sp. TaxID=2050685 RepID=UPI0025F9BF05|nr:hypothetical protein [Demequina sp.]